MKVMKFNDIWQIFALSILFIMLKVLTFKYYVITENAQSLPRKKTWLHKLNFNLFFEVTFHIESNVMTD